jgi:DNA-binding XRE family transcriptional regulator
MIFSGFLSIKNRLTMTHSQEDQDMILRDRKIFARNLREARKQKGLTQEDIQKKTGLTQQFISDVENGKTTLSLDNANLLAAAVEQPIWKLTNPVRT